MAIGQAEVAQSRTTGAKPIGDDGVGHASQPFRKSPHELESRLPVTPRLHEDAENLALIVNRAPEMMDRATDPDEGLVRMPAARGLWPTPADPPGMGAAELTGIGWSALGTPAAQTS